MSRIEFTQRELVIMNEAFMTGRIYSNLGERESPSEINDKLVRNCEMVIIRTNNGLSITETEDEK